MCSRVPDSKPEHYLEFFFRLPLMQASLSSGWIWVNLAFSWSECHFQGSLTPKGNMLNNRGFIFTSQILWNIHHMKTRSYSNNVKLPCLGFEVLLWMNRPAVPEGQNFFLAVAVFFLVSALRMKHMPINWYNPYFFLIMQTKFYTFWLENLVC